MSDPNAESESVSLSEPLDDRLRASKTSSMSSSFSVSRFKKSLRCNNEHYLLSAATMLTTMEVVVDELCTSTVARIPIMSPATGLLRILSRENTSPAVFPPSNRKALLRKSNEQMNRYKRPRRRMILRVNRATRFTLPQPSSSVSA